MTPTTDYKLNLDKIQRTVFQFLKPLGFKKKGRTFNKEVDKGIFQIINFQSGQFPVGDKYVIPGLRDSYYGKFTVNMGVLVQELFDLSLPSIPMTFYQEHHSQIRTRLTNLTKGQDIWWDLTGNTDDISKEIIEGLNSVGLAWFDLFETRKKICDNWGNVEGSSLRAKLDVALIVLQSDRQRGEKLFQEYYDNISDHKGHKEYVRGLATQLQLTVKTSS